MLTEKEEFTLKYYRDKNSEKVSIELDLDTEIIEYMDEFCKENNITRDEFLSLALTRQMIDIEKEKHLDEFKNIIDIFDFYKIEEIIETNEKYLVIDPLGKNLVLLPIEQYNKIRNFFSGVGNNDKEN